MLGAVVVGAGTAGCVRVRDLLSPLAGTAAETLAIRGFVSRRTVDRLHGVKQISLDEAVSREDVHVAFICTENETHEEHVRTFLQVGKHVCVEYPMTTSHQAAVDLWDLARDRGLVLHEEHMELLTEEFLALKEAVRGRVLQEGELHFTGGALRPGFGFPAFSGVARLTWLVELFGELSVAGAALEEDPGRGYVKMTAELLTADRRPLTWTEERQAGLPRTKRVRFVLDSGTLTQIPPAPRGSVGLFMQDLVLFSNKLAGRAGPQEVQTEKVRILHCLDLADRIQRLCRG